MHSNLENTQITHRWSNSGAYGGCRLIRWSSCCAVHSCSRVHVNSLCFAISDSPLPAYRMGGLEEDVFRSKSVKRSSMLSAASPACASCVA
ncbi:expressed protein [Echinococcus multilocularis]|uniref:Expressed protein n=1 Tax=Echinococcus multilocularis TaxID=6211 RepID=A0A068XTJ1_ECHMU|nr:expressed protein [Echinococcus multilocularis]